MSDDRADDADDPVKAARESGSRLALAFVILVSVAFIFASSAQIIPAVFGFGFEPLRKGSPGSPEGRCASGIRDLAQALDRATGRLASIALAADDTTVMAALRPDLSPEWDRADAVRAACNDAEGGRLAWAALERLRVADEQSGRIDKDDIAAVRRDVAAHLPADLR